MDDLSASLSLMSKGWMIRWMSLVALSAGLVDMSRGWINGCVDGWKGTRSTGNVYMSGGWVRGSGATIVVSTFSAIL